MSAEIDAVFDVPLVEILDPARYREETWRAPGSPPADIPFFELDGGTVWGATAVMLLELLAAVLEAPVARGGRPGGSGGPVSEQALGVATVDPDGLAGEKGSFG